MKAQENSFQRPSMWLKIWQHSRKVLEETGDHEYPINIPAFYSIYFQIQHV